MTLRCVAGGALGRGADVLVRAPAEAWLTSGLAVVPPHAPVPAASAATAPAAAPRLRMIDASFTSPTRVKAAYTQIIWPADSHSWTSGGRSLTGRDYSFDHGAAASPRAAAPQTAARSRQPAQRGLLRCEQPASRPGRTSPLAWCRWRSGGAAAGGRSSAPPTRGGERREFREVLAARCGHVQHGPQVQERDTRAPRRHHGLPLRVAVLGLRRPELKVTQTSHLSPPREDASLLSIAAAMAVAQDARTA